MMTAIIARPDVVQNAVAGVAEKLKLPPSMPARPASAPAMTNAANR